MKKHIMRFSVLFASACLLTACSKDITDNHNAQEQPEGLMFTMSEAPYNADTDMGTRAVVAPVLKDTLNFGGIETEVTLERDSEPHTSLTRAITSGNHYTIVAFKAGTSTEVASAKGHFDTATGAFRYDADSKMMQIPAGNYDFACYTHQYATRSGNTVSISLTNADKAFVCRLPNVTIANIKRQEISFTMKHAGVRLRTKLTTFSEEPTGMTFTFGSVAGITPSEGVYDLTTGSFSSSADKTASNKLETQTYDKQSTYDATFEDHFITLTGKDYITVPAGIKPEELAYQIVGGTLYRLTPNLNMPAPRKLKASGDFEANGSYTLTIKMMPKYIYLFEDGKTGALSDADRKEHIPIAVVFDTAGKRAVALWDGAGGAKTQWTSYDPAGDNCNSSDYDFSAGGDVSLYDSRSGKIWTWEHYLCGYPFVTTPKVSRTDFHAYHTAGNFYHSADLTSHLGTKTLASSLNKDEVWYLPSAYEWGEVFTKLGFGKSSDLSVGGWRSWKGTLVNYAFKVAQGASIAGNSPTYYWTATEYFPGQAHYAGAQRSGMYFSAYGEEMYGARVTRAFVSY